MRISRSAVVFLLAASTIVTIASWQPAFVRAQTDSSGNQGELQETIRAAILADPRTASLPPDQLDAMVSALSDQAQRQGMTAQAIAYRPTDPYIRAVRSLDQGCEDVSAVLCPLSKAWGFGGTDHTNAYLFFATSGILALVAAAMLRQQAATNPQKPAA